MKFTGELTVKAPRAQVYKAVRDARFFASCVDGVNDLAEIAPDTYSAVFETKVAYMKFSFKVTVEVVRAEEPRDQIRRQERRVARNGGDQRLRRVREPHVEPRERAREALDRVGNDAKAERRVSIEVLVGVDQDVVDLRREPVQHVSHHGSAVKRHQALVDSAHAPALATGEHHAAHSARRRRQASGRNRSPPANSRKCLLVARPIMVMPTFCAIS